MTKPSNLLPAPDDLELTEAECKHLAASARCEACGHLDVFHDHEYSVCNIDGCRCQGGQLRPLAERRGPLTSVQPVGQPLTPRLLFAGTPPRQRR